MTCTTYFLRHRDGHPIRFVLGESCPCSDLSLATFFPDLVTAIEARDAHCRKGTKVMICHMKAEEIKFKKILEPSEEKA